VSDLVPVIRSDAHLAHAGLIELASGVEIPCWESPERILAIEAALAADGGFAFEAPTDHGREPILAVHDAKMVEVFEHAWTDALAAGGDGSRPWFPDTFLLAAYLGPMPPGDLPTGAHHRLGAYLFDTATPIVAGTWGAAIAAVDVAVSTAARVVGGAPLAYGLCRPPGHHAEPDRAMGFCLFNSIAVAARHALAARGLSRVAILDWDVHHGNGTQAIFWDDPTVLAVSIHEWPFYPGTGGPNEQAETTLNVPLPAGSGDEEYERAFDELVEPAVRAFEPELVLVSAGFDAHRDDPLANMNVSDDGFRELARRSSALAPRCAAVLEGGYNLSTLPRLVAAALEGFS